ncbi:MAG TPA: hypothetical protein DEZ27_09460 [Sphaerochaeta sp.]|nr:hypothetical protein [Sphaerochaeta sp.]
MKSPPDTPPLLLGSLSSFLAERSRSNVIPEGSFLHASHRDIDSWRTFARQRFLTALQVPSFELPEVATIWSRSFDGLTIEKLRWSLPFGNATEAYLLKPRYMQGKLPGVLALHDHGGNKFFGKSKLVRVDGTPHKHLATHQDTYYGGLAWANELAKRGYVVLVHDVFPFESRRIRFDDLPPGLPRSLLRNPVEIEEPAVNTRNKGNVMDVLDDTIDGYERYNACARQMETVIAKTMFVGGVTWPGITLAEDRIALEILASRSEVDRNRIGCCGLSLGGLRSVYLAGSTDGIAAAVVVGFMTTWNDFVSHIANDHTWMAIVPGISHFMDFPDIMGMHAPKPAMVCSCTEDPLFTQTEVRRAEHLLDQIYRKTGNSSQFDFSHYQGSHRFDKTMQENVFAWLDQHL